jgi:cytosine/adenosine deaminase-related metal-dependent hydrolase
MNPSRLVIEGCAVATVDPSGSEYGYGHLVVEGNRIVAVGEGLAPEEHARDAGKLNGARCLGREAEIGSLEVGKLADVAVWRVDDFVHAGIEDSVTALVFDPAPRVELLLVNGEPVVQDAELRTAKELEIAREIASASRRLAEKMEVAS